MRPARASILLVDDRQENLMALEAILEPLGHRLVRAGSGEEALRQVLAHDFACILLDVQMPGMNGFETAQIIKSREKSRHVPIIFLTAISKDEEFIFEGYSVGAVDYMFKPFNPDILRSKVTVLVDLYLKTQQLQEQARRLAESERRELELRHRSELLESEARMAEIVGSAMEAIITFDGEGKITLFNAAAERMFGVPRAEAEGRGIGEFFDPPLADGVLEEICGGARSAAGERAEGGGALRERAMTGVRPGGETFPVEASVSCLELPAEQVFTVIARDVSERRRAEEALRQQAEWLAQTTEQLQQANEQLQARQRELESAMSARSRFYASMSHELRTPINAILGYSSLLLDNIYGPLTPEQARGIERANKAARHLLELVNDILDLSKIEAGKVELEVQPTGFPDLVQDLFVTVRPLADEHGTELGLDMGGAEEITVFSDPRRVRQILLNLLSNAIKFGEGKPIAVCVRPLDEGGVAVEVSDRGRGIAREDLDKIFDEFVQLHPDQAEGTGLGLPISRRLAELLDGRLEVESRLGEGSTFRLLLPARISPRPLLLDDEGLAWPGRADDNGDLLAPLPQVPAAPAAPEDEPAEEEGARAAG